jgi:hypothetical protein
MDWRSTWKNTVGENEFSNSIDTIDNIDKTPVQDSAAPNSVNSVNIVNAPSGQTIAVELSEETDLFLYLHDSITNGGPYRKLWSKIRNYIGWQLPAEMFNELEMTFQAHGGAV